MCQPSVCDYSLSQTVMLLCGPFALVPVMVAVIILPSWDITKILVWTNFPAFVRLIIMVRSSTRVEAAGMLIMLPNCPPKC
jgi:hypothetical protein